MEVRASERMVSGDIPHDGDMIPVEVWRTFRPGDMDGEFPLYVLEWGDNVANEWTEAYHTLGQALGRLAVLADTGRTLPHEPSLAFRHNPQWFELVWDRFSREAVE